MAWNQLPPEIILGILTYLDYKFILRCSSVCRHFHDTIHGSISLQYQMELEICGMLDSGRASDMSIPERLEALRTKQRNWFELRWTKSVMPIRRGSFDTSLKGGVMAQRIIRNPESLRFFQLKPMNSSPAGRVWEHHFGVGFIGFAIDPDQDLLVLLEEEEATSETQVYLRVHLRTLITNVAHPDAHARLEFSVMNNSRYRVYSHIEIMGDILAIRLYTPFGYGQHVSEFKLWDWRTASVLATITAEPNFICSFCFLSESYFMLAIVGSPFGDDPEKEDDPTLDVYAINKTGLDQEASPILSFHLPILKPGCRTAGITLWSNPAISSRTRTSPFFDNPDAQVCTCALYLKESKWGETIHLVISIKEVLSYLSSVTEAPLHVLWSYWGEAATRWVPWGTKSYGSRVITLVRPDFPTTNIRCLKIMDFNITSAMRYTRSIREELVGKARLAWSYQGLVTEPSGPNITHMFEKPLSTALPYMETISQEQFEPQVEIDLDHIYLIPEIGVRIGDQVDMQILKISGFD